MKNNIILYIVLFRVVGSGCYRIFLLEELQQIAKNTLR